MVEDENGNPKKKEPETRRYTIKQRIHDEEKEVKFICTGEDARIALKKASRDDCDGAAMARFAGQLTATVREGKDKKDAIEAYKQLVQVLPTWYGMVLKMEKETGQYPRFKQYTMRLIDQVTVAFGKTTIDSDLIEKSLTEITCCIRNEHTAFKYDFKEPRDVLAHFELLSVLSKVYNKSVREIKQNLKANYEHLCNLSHAAAGKKMLEHFQVFEGKENVVKQTKINLKGKMEVQLTQVRDSLDECENSLRPCEEKVRKVCDEWFAIIKKECNKIVEPGSP
ncbi:hypothetical protein BJ508DRAFT_375758 [Ascobolus immersus RN42]|uniref:Uncharacterized protein n=1 Tax=Ascobolus immersus RN42 TaxID=1160509 RepID=A0A3N4IAN0_ASCIM|nr:hypothetical protein BJ508DRAFT_375758 [Ascobolus immersus RN42]